MSTSLGRLIIQMPWLRWLPFLNIVFNRLAQHFADFYHYVDQNICARIELRKSEESSMHEKTARNDFIEAFLIEMENINAEKDGESEDKSYEQYFTYNF